MLEDVPAGAEAWPACGAQQSGAMPAPCERDAGDDDDAARAPFYDAPSPESAAAAHKESGNASFRAGAWAEAEAAYSAGLAALDGAGDGDGDDGGIVTLRAALLCNRAAARLAAEGGSAAAAAAAADDCTAALALSPGYARALLRRAAARERLGELEGLEGALAGAAEG